MFRNDTVAVQLHRGLGGKKMTFFFFFWAVLLWCLAELVSDASHAASGKTGSNSSQWTAVTYFLFGKSENKSGANGNWNFWPEISRARTPVDTFRRPERQECRTSDVLLSSLKLHTMAHVVINGRSNGKTMRFKLRLTKRRLIIRVASP